MSSVPGPCLPAEVAKGQVFLALEKENLQLRTFSQALGFTVLGAAFVSVVLGKWQYIFSCHYEEFLLV